MSDLKEAKDRLRFLLGPTARLYKGMGDIEAGTGGGNVKFEIGYLHTNSNGHRVIGATFDGDSFLEDLAVVLGPEEDSPTPEAMFDQIDNTTDKTDAIKIFMETIDDWRNGAEFDKIDHTCELLENKMDQKYFGSFACMLTTPGSGVFDRPAVRKLLNKAVESVDPAIKEETKNYLIKKLKP
jgi:hypothetical protein